MCPPEHPRSSVSIPKKRMVREEFNDGCAFVGRLGRAHRHRPYQTPLYFSTQSYTNKITICTQSTQTKSTIPRAIHPNETVGAAPVCPPERPRSDVSIPKIHALCIGINDGCALVGRHGRAHRHRPYQSPLYIRVQSSQTISTTQTKRVNNLHNTSGAEMHRALPPPFSK